MRLWVYKVNIDEENAAYGDWEQLFDDLVATGIPQAWGGAWATNKPNDKRHFTELTSGDRILAWQSNRQVAVGLLEVDRVENGGDDVFLKMLERFTQPVPINKLKKVHPGLRDVSAFKQGHAGTLYATSSDEAALLLKVCAAAQI
jgi:hypothetical protein